MPGPDEAEDDRAARQRALAAANNWDQLTVTGRSYLAVALTAATFIAAAMVWSLLPAAVAMAGDEARAGDRFQFYFAFGSLIGAPALGWWLWSRRRPAFAIGMLVVFGLSVAALLPLTRL